MSLPPYPGPEGSSGDEPREPQTPGPETPGPETPGPETPGPTRQPYGEQPPQPPESPYGQPPAYGQQPQNPYGQPPVYGQQPAYGQQPPAYGYGAYAGANEASRGWSGTAIASFVTSLLCCGIPAIVLGIIGIFRTGEGKGKGRWMAVTGIALGVVGTLAGIGLFIGGYWVFNNNITPDNAEVGQCVDVEVDDDSAVLWKKDCDESHDAEVFAVHEVTAEEADRFSTSSEVVELCAQEAGDVQTASGEPLVSLFVSGDYTDRTIYEHEETEEGDGLICLIEADSGKLDEKVLD